jgi:hypothetical protein
MSLPSIPASEDNAIISDWRLNVHPTSLGPAPPGYAVQDGYSSRGISAKRTAQHSVRSGSVSIHRPTTASANTPLASSELQRTYVHLWLLMCLVVIPIPASVESLSNVSLEFIEPRTAPMTPQEAASLASLHLNPSPSYRELTLVHSSMIILKSFVTC